MKCYRITWREKGLIINPILVDIYSLCVLYIFFIDYRYTLTYMSIDLSGPQNRSRWIDPEAQLLDSRGEAASGLLPGILSLGFFFRQKFPPNKNGGRVFWVVIKFHICFKSTQFFTWNFVKHVKLWGEVWVILEIFNDYTWHSGFKISLWCQSIKRCHERIDGWRIPAVQFPEFFGCGHFYLWFRKGRNAISKYIYTDPFIRSLWIYVHQCPFEFVNICCTIICSYFDFHIKKYPIEAKIRHPGAMFFI